MIHAVADQVHQRIAQLVDDRLVELRIRAFDGQLDILAKIPRQVVDQAAEFLERATKLSTLCGCEVRQRGRKVSTVANAELFKQSFREEAREIAVDLESALL
ncbi:MAG: hypothetical protein P4L40_25045, partial [Terracidiphilus sp.]|nr:hypothetical protein [Terracidiphilus sp.]